MNECCVDGGSGEIDEDDDDDVYTHFYDYEHSMLTFVRVISSD